MIIRETYLFCIFSKLGNQPIESNSSSHEDTTSQNNASASLSQSKSTTESIFGSVGSGLTFGDLSNSAASFSTLAANVQSVGFQKDSNVSKNVAGQQIDILIDLVFTVSVSWRWTSYVSKSRGGE